MPQKSIYVSEEDLNLYRYAEKISGKSFSTLVADLITTYVRRKEAEGNIYAVCELTYQEDEVTTLNPLLFVRTPFGNYLEKVKEFVTSNKLVDTNESFLVFYPVGRGGEFDDKLMNILAEGKLDIVSLEE